MNLKIDLKAAPTSFKNLPKSKWSKIEVWNRYGPHLEAIGASWALLGGVLGGIPGAFWGLGDY